MKALTVATASTFEPVTLTEAKLHLRVDGSTEDALITGLIAAARDTAETESKRTLATRTYDYTLDQWPSHDRLWLPMPPVQSVTSITCTDVDNAAHVMSTSDYYVDLASGRICLHTGKSWPSYSLRPYAGIVVRYVAGYGSGLAPETYKAAIKLLIGHWYANREAVITGMTANELPMAVKALLTMDQAPLPE